MKKSTLLLLLVIVANNLFASEGVGISVFYPAKDFQQKTIRADFARFDPGAFSKEYTPFHAAIEQVYKHVKGIEMHGSQQPSLDRIEIEDGIVIIHSKHQRQEEQNVRGLMRLCLKLSIGETLRYRTNINIWGRKWTGSHGLYIPEVKGFTFRYASGYTWPTEGYFAVAPPVVDETFNQPQTADRTRSNQAGDDNSE